MSLGSKKNNNGLYLLYIPFTISPGIEIQGIDTAGSCEIKILGYDCIIKKILDNLYSLKIRPFRTTEEACEFLPKAFSFLYWLSLKQQIGLTFPHYIQDESLPKHIDNNMKSLLDQLRLEIKGGSINPSNTIRVQDDAKIVSYSYAKGTATLIKDFKKSEESFEFTSPEKVITQKNLILAIELYSNYQYENTDNARFITLVTVLEALTPDYEAPEVAQNAIDALKTLMRKKREEYSRENDDEWEHLNFLLSRVGKLKREAIGKSMSIYISEIIETDGELGNPVAISKKLKVIYKNRSDLLHQGKFEKTEIKENLDFLRDFVPKLLKKLYISSVSP